MRDHRYAAIFDCQNFSDLYPFWASKRPIFRDLRQPEPLTPESEGAAHRDVEGCVNEPSAALVRFAENLYCRAMLRDVQVVGVALKKGAVEPNAAESDAEKACNVPRIVHSC